MRHDTAGGQISCGFIFGRRLNLNGAARSVATKDFFDGDGFIFLTVLSLAGRGRRGFDLAVFIISQLHLFHFFRRRFLIAAVVGN